MDACRPVISLFSGAGGLDLAVERCCSTHDPADGGGGPLRVAVALDWEPDAVATLRRNFDCAVLQEDILRTPTSAILGAGGLSPGDATLVVGGPPCTPFSKSGFWLDYKRESRDPNASLLDEFARVLRKAGLRHLFSRTAKVSPTERIARSSSVLRLDFWSRATIHSGGW